MSQEIKKYSGLVDYRQKLQTSQEDSEIVAGRLEWLTSANQLAQFIINLMLDIHFYP